MLTFLVLVVEYTTVGMFCRASFENGSRSYTCIHRKTGGSTALQFSWGPGTRKSQNDRQMLICFDLQCLAMQVKKQTICFTALAWADVSNHMGSGAVRLSWARNGHIHSEIVTTR